MMTTHELLKHAAKQAIDTMHAEARVSPEEMRDSLTDLSNHIDDLMRAIDAREISAAREITRYGEPRRGTETGNRGGKRHESRNHRNNGATRKTLGLWST